MTKTPRAPRPIRDDRQKLSPRQVARLWGVGLDRIRNLIRTGQLIAMNIATDPAGKPRYLIDRKEMEAFEQRRATKPAPKQTSRPRKADDDGTTEFF